MSTEFYFRIGGMIFFGIVGGLLGYQLGGSDLTWEAIRYALIVGLISALGGLVLTPYITTRPARWIRARLSRLSAETLFAGLTGHGRGPADRRAAGVPTFPAAAALGTDPALCRRAGIYVAGRLAVRHAPGRHHGTVQHAQWTGG